MRRDAEAGRDELGALIEAFVNLVSHPRGRALQFRDKASVTVDQAILLSFVAAAADSAPSSLAARMGASLPSISQMIERLVKLGYLERTESRTDRRRKTIRATAKARRFLERLGDIRAAEYALGANRLSEPTALLLAKTLRQVLAELSSSEIEPDRTGG